MQAIDAVGEEGGAKGQAAEQARGGHGDGARQAQAVSHLRSQVRLAQERQRLAAQLREAFPGFEAAVEELSGGEKVGGRAPVQAARAQDTHGRSLESLEASGA